MRAAVVTSFTQPLEIVERPTPAPAAGQVLVRIEACGLCHTDIHAARGDWPAQPTLPFVPGHEGVGIVEALGAGVAVPAIGTRVAIPWLGRACGRCEYCVTGRETLCGDQDKTGYTVDGAYAEYAVAAANYVVPVPDGIDPVEAAPLACAGLTSYAAVKNGQVRSTDVVGIWGAGGLGHLAVQYAKIAGATVIALDVRQHKLDDVRALGADHQINPLLQDAVKAVQRLGGVDVAIVTAAAPAAFEQAYASLRPGGRLVCVGLPRDGSFTVPIVDLVLGGKTVLGSIVGTRQDLAEVFELHAAGRTRVVTEVSKLAEVNEAIDAVLTGRASGRVVLVP